MSIRLAKQIVYAAFYIILWMAVIWGGYKLATRGAVQAPVVAGPQAVSILADAHGAPVDVFTTGTNQETFLAKIANLNTDYATQSFDYSFNVYDASNTLLQSYLGHSFLYAQEVKYLLLANQAIPAGVARADLTIRNVQWVQASALGNPPQFTKQNVVTQMSSSTNESVATGELTNQDVSSFNNVLIVAIFKDAQGNALGASQTLFDSIAPNQTKNFSIIYPSITGIAPTQTEVEAYAMR